MLWEGGKAVPGCLGPHPALVSSPEGAGHVPQRQLLLRRVLPCDVTVSMGGTGVVGRYGGGGGVGVELEGIGQWEAPF